MKIKKILCFCGSGLGTSFVMEMNVKKALKNLGIDDIEVEHSTIDDVMPGAADLFICGADLLPNALKAGMAIGLNNMVSVEEIQTKLKQIFEQEN
ncbi:PTS sugar transporter subunit IIB [Anaerosacchariphilus polymeriproducens]|uniref:PTS sugar transporter subunit IIB n=1 Tax=Anaerosacchariphilus polymeriproducens TaxID=1812858 RepID=A0A371AY41_9FIRM|nr:PTS sugar transporter subunit IIB [Anaerosacchariphilus polymeriproducens]RDU24410.1 PTS sugar transporter subunit IIB [Anaerosacchariphilus polymeriproducens]